MHSVSRHHDVGGKYSEQDAEAMCIQWRGGDDLLYIHSVQNKSVECDKIKIKAKKKYVRITLNPPSPPHTHTYTRGGWGNLRDLQGPRKTRQD